jgi:hypothetical protein
MEPGEQKQIVAILSKLPQIVPSLLATLPLHDWASRQA